VTDRLSPHTIFRSHAIALGLGAVLLLAAIAPALAVCPICNGSVRLDKSLAVCFSGRVETELQRLKSEGRGFVIVDLSDCPQAGDRGGLPTGATKQPAPLDASFVADDASLRCLGSAIVAHATELDPSHVFDLTQLCS
jgi:hypothetical protein